jgi:hypothetical protein
MQASARAASTMRRRNDAAADGANFFVALTLVIFNNLRIELGENECAGL